MYLPIMLGRLILTTARTLIDIQEGKLTFRLNGEELTFNFNASKDLDLWHGKAFKPKEVNVVQELFKEGYYIETLDSQTYNTLI